MPKNKINLPAFSDGVWFKSWFASFAPNAEIILGEQSDPVTLLKQGEVRLLGLKLKALLSPTNEHSPRYEWTINEKNISKIRDWLSDCREKLDWDIVEMDFVPENTATYRFFCQLARESGWFLEIQPWHETAVIDLRLSEDDYYSSLSRKIKSNTNRAENGLKRLGSLTFFDAGQSDDWQDWLRQALEVEAMGWKGNKGSAIMQRENEEVFYQEVFAEAQQQDRLKLYILLLDGKLIAFNLLILWNDIYYGMKMAYLEEYSKYSTGNVLQRYVLRALFAEKKHAKLDMLDPVTAWKSKWCTDIELLYRVRIYSPRLRPRLIYYCRKLIRFSKKQWLKMAKFVKKK